MPLTFGPFDAGAGSSITESFWTAMARLWLHTGVLRGEGNELSVFADSTGMQVKVPTGTAWVEGQACLSDSQVTLTIGAANASNPRIDRVVLRKDANANTFALLVLAGTPAASPAPPALTQTSAIYDLPLAQVLVPANASTITSANVTDERPLVGNVDLTAIQTVYNKTLVTPTIASFVNAQHSHADSAGGGVLALSRPAQLGALAWDAMTGQAATLAFLNDSYEWQFPAGGTYTIVSRDILWVPPTYNGSNITVRIKGYSPTANGTYTLNLLAAVVSDGSPPYPTLTQVATATVNSHGTAGATTTWTLTWSSNKPAAGGLQDLHLGIQRANSGTADTLHVRKVLLDFGS